MATPRSEQFIPGALPGQAATASPSSQLFQAIGGVGRQIQQKGQEMIDLEEREAEERKRQEDKLAAREFTNEIRLTQQKFNTDMDNAKSDEEIDEIASARSAYLQDFLNSRENMSDELKEELQLEADFQSSASEEMARAAKNNRLKKRQLSAAESSVGIAVMDGDKEALSDAVDAMDEAGAFGSPEHKQEFLRIEQNRISRNELAGSLAEINASRSAEEIDALEEQALESGALNEEDANKLKKASKYRKNTIAREDYTLIGTQISVESGIISRIEKGEYFSDEEIDSLNIDEEAKRLLKDAGKELQPGLNQTSIEYKNLLQSINDEFENDPLLSTIGPNEISAEKYEQFYRQIEDRPFDTSAKMALMSHLMKMRAVDARKDKDLSGFFETVETPDGTVMRVRDQNIELENGQVQMLQDATRDLASKIATSNGRVIASKTGMTYTDFVDLMFLFQDPATLEKFKGLEPGSKEYNEMYNEVITGAIVKKNQKTSIQLLRDRILNLRNEQLELREEITDGG